MGTLATVCTELPIIPLQKKVLLVLKFAGYLHSYKILPVSVFGLVFRKNIAATVFLLNFFRTLLHQRTYEVHFPNLQDMFIMAKSLPWNYFGCIDQTKRIASEMPRPQSWEI